MARLRSLFNPFILFLYRVLPAAAVRQLGRSHLLQPLRNTLLRGKDGETLTTVEVQWELLKPFFFRAPLQKAQQAKTSGIEPHLLRAALQLLNYTPETKNDYVVMDVGASYGFLSCVLAETVCSPHGKVYAFEPHPYIHKALQETIRLNSWANVEAIQAAVGQENTKANLYLLHDSSNVRNLKSVSENEKLPVNMITLDQFAAQKNLTRCDLLKIDVDGFEPEVLTGAQKLILQFKPVIICESNQQPQVAQLLLQAGYTLMNEKLEQIDGALPLPHDIIATPR